jgi:cytochrome c-type biogenesis protein
MSALAVAAAFTAGLSTSVGPCVAPRYLALTAIVARTRGRERWVRIGYFVAGLLACYALLATTASLISGVTALSRIVYVLLALGFLGFGLHALTVHSACSHGIPAQPSSGATLLGGSALGLVLSPCCTPVVAMMASMSISSGSYAMALTGALAFAAGHVAPLVTIGLGLGVAERFAPIRALSDAATTVSGGLSIALAAYYGLLA